MTSHAATSICFAFAAALAVPAHAQAPLPLPVQGGHVEVHPRTGELWIAGGNPPTFAIHAPSTGASSTVAIPASARDLLLDPIHDRARIRHADGVAIVDRATMTPIPVALGGAIGPVGLDPGADHGWAVDQSGREIHRIDGATGAVETQPVSGFPSNLVAVDPHGGRAFVLTLPPALLVFGGAPLALLDELPLPVDPFIEALAASISYDPVADRVFVVDSQGDGNRVQRIDLASGAVASATGFTEIVGAFYDPTRDRLWSLADASGQSGALRAHVGDTLALAGSVFTFFDGFTGSPATGFVYAPDSSLDLLRVLDGSTAAEQTVPLPLDSPNDPVLDVERGLLYLRAVGGRYALLEPAGPAPVPLVTTIANAPPQTGQDLVVQLTASSDFPRPLPIRQIYYRLGGSGPWLAAPTPGAAATISLPLPPGGAVAIEAFATDGQEATLSTSFRTNARFGPLVGPVTTALLPTVCANGVDDDGDGATDFPADTGCRDASSTSVEAPACANGIDDDGDGAIDFPADAQCEDAWGEREGNPRSTCGLGAELALVLAALAGRRRR